VLLSVAALRISGRRPRVAGLLGERCALLLLLHLQPVPLEPELGE